MEGKNVIYFYRDWWDFLEDLDMRQRGEWITYVMQYVNDLSPVLPNDKQVMSICKITKNQLKRDLEDWKKSIEKKSEAGKKGMASRWGNKENITSDNNVITNDNIVITTNNDKDKVKDKEKDKVIDKVIDKDIDTILSKEIEEGEIKTLKKLIELLEVEIYNKNLTNIDGDVLRRIHSKGYSYDSIYRDLTEYKKRGINDPITYYDRAFKNAESQEKVFKKIDADEIKNNNTPKTYEFNDFMSAFKVFTDEDAPQHIRDKAKEFMDGKRGN